MTFSFHDLKKVIEFYLDDLVSHYHMRMRHPYHFPLVFERFHHFQIWLNPHKCIFCMKSGHLLGFIVSKEGIRVDPLKVEKMLFGLKNAGATFQWAMTLIFHDLKSIIEVFLDDLTAHSWLRVHHPYHLRLVFERCHHYLVRLNPHKCGFCMKSGRLLGFIVSKEGIRVDPLKVEAILQLSLPRNIRHLQCLQGMANFLWRSVVNFANLTRGFMHLLKKDTTFCWDERA